MIAVEQLVDGITARAVTFAADQPEYAPLPALVFPDGSVLTEWTFTEEERTLIARGENLRLWIWPFGCPLQPVALVITDERIA
jgi:hypothetical protein